MSSDTAVVMTEKEPSRSGEANTSAKTRLIYAWFLVVLCAFFYCYEYFLRIQPSVITAELMRTFNIGAGTLGAITACYYYAYTPMQLPVGILMDRYNPRIILSLACAVCGLGTYLFASTTHLWVAAIGRLLIGFGSAFAFVGVLKVATLWLPQRHFAFVAGITTMLGMIGAMFGDVILVKLVSVIGWQTTLIKSAYLGFFTALLLYLAIPREKKKVVSQLSEKSSTIFQDVMNIVRQPKIWKIGFIGLILYLSLSVLAELWGPSFLQSAHAFSSTGAAFCITMVFAGWAIGAPLMGAISDHLRKRVMLLRVGALMSALFISPVLFVSNLPHTLIYCLLFFFGIFSSTEILVFAIARDDSSEHSIGTSLAIINMLIMLGGIIFQPLVGMLLDYCWSGQLENGVRVFSASDYQHALLFLPVSLLFAVGLTFFLEESH